MKTLLLYGEPSHDTQAGWLWDYLTRYQPVGVISPGKIVIPQGAFHLLMLEQSTLPLITAELLLVVLHGDCPSVSFASLPTSSVMIVDSGNHHHRALLSTFCGKVISFGRSQTDTVTFSSCGENKAVVCLQRAIVALDGTLLEPMEIPCIKSPDMADEVLLELITTLLVLNQLHLSPSPKGSFFWDSAPDPVGGLLAPRNPLARDQSLDRNPTPC